jgi:hypothetical protein
MVTTTKCQRCGQNMFFCNDLPEVPGEWHHADPHFDGFDHSLCRDGRPGIPVATPAYTARRLELVLQDDHHLTTGERVAVAFIIAFIIFMSLHIIAAL